MDAGRSRVGTRFGPYELRSLLGRGGMGEVYEAYDTVKDRVVAVKLLPTDLARDPVFQQRFRRESQAAARLAEPHVIPIHDWGEIDRVLYIDMRLVRGRDLRTVLIDQGPLSPVRAVGILEQIAAALDAAHAGGLVHRDVKPANILVTNSDFAYLADFGIALSTDDPRVTATGAAVGSYSYIAPERFDDGPVTGTADVYSLACVLYESLTGTQPFPADGMSMLIRSHLSMPPPRPSIKRAELPGELDEVISRGMAKEPADRYPTAGALASAARAAVTGHGALRNSELPTVRMGKVPTAAPVTVVFSTSGAESQRGTTQPPPGGQPMDRTVTSTPGPRSGARMPQSHQGSGNEGAPMPGRADSPPASGMRDSSPMAGMRDSPPMPGKRDSPPASGKSVTPVSDGTSRDRIATGMPQARQIGRPEHRPMPGQPTSARAEGRVLPPRGRVQPPDGRAQPPGGRVLPPEGRVQPPESRVLLPEPETQRLTAMPDARPSVPPPAAEPEAPRPAAGRRRMLLLCTVIAVLVAVGVGCVIAWQRLSGGDPIATPPLPAGATPCPRINPEFGRFTTSAIGTPVTTCPFAEEVRRVYGESGNDVEPIREVVAFSSVTGQEHIMRCEVTGQIVTCSGGENAVVYVY